MASSLAVREAPPPTRRMTGPGPAAAIPPRAASASLDREGVARRLDEAAARRLTSVVAGPGWGKTTALARWAETRGACWLTLRPEDGDLGSLARGLLASVRRRLPAVSPGLPSYGSLDTVTMGLCEELDLHLDGDLVVVLDDAQELPGGSAATSLIERLVHAAPRGFHLVLSSRSDPPFPVHRLRGQGHMAQVDSSTLRFGPEEVASLLTEVAGQDAGRVARELWETTSGWPAAVRLAAESLRGLSYRRCRLELKRLHRPGGPILDYLLEEVLAREPESTRELLADLAVLGPVTPRLCRAIGMEAAEEAVPSLVRRGLVEAANDPDGSWSIIRPLQDVLAARRSPDDAVALHRAAAGFHVREGRYGEAVRHLATAGERHPLVRLVAEHGPRMIGDGQVGAVIAAADAIGAFAHDPRVHRVIGQARQITGDWNGALAAFGRVAGGDGALDADIAWRMGLLWHLRGDLEEALRIYERGTPGDGTTADEALLLAWHASAQWSLGDFGQARDKAERALTAAERCAEPGALATAHTTMAMVVAATGDRGANAWHYSNALAYAERATRSLELLRIRVNLSSRFLEEGLPARALDEAEHAISLAELCGYEYYHALALTNRGIARRTLARYEGALGDFTRAHEIYQRLGSAMASYALTGLGDVYRESGEVARARGAYEQALEAAEKSGDLQSVSGAVIGLARVRAADDLPAARELAERAVLLGQGLHQVQALVTRGWVALLMDDREDAARDARAAGGLARARRDRLGLAEALELAVLSAEFPSSGLPSLREAHAIYREVPDPIGEARVEILTEWLEGGMGRPALERAEERLRRHGVRTLQGTVASSLAVMARAGGPAIEVYTFGSLRVIRDGTPIPAAEWRSKKARDLLKILLARRGRPLSREALMDLLWPGEGDVAGNRLSVLLYTLRRVLNPARQGAEGPLVATRTTVRLDVAAMEVDAERFSAAADAGLRAFRQGDPGAGRLLAVAESVYGGEFLEEDLYEDWAAQPREEYATRYVAVIRALVELAERSGDVDRVVACCLRLLARDPYDESVHLRLVKGLLEAGRHGEARRRYQDYWHAMREIGVEPAPRDWPAPEAGRRRDPGQEA
ncbi:BTAD domain-containing putative transcriptional regulator [Sphaerisporangium sp. TRM90804]|uniref:BTAD domain-containing putative transcriptional regulator n=1 Tax=Sphaerisporangium sp. TRM90804 TaxID=3031113 RepID=UPI00244BC620|nr:BTAD domain-containing putative transcriptional regulator [Sphaerisporangium sp. TRM90804]MDH2429478.1 BTAD domain-containing putative transcriptional regulator [Sphaerisporangium sp. TRM90804]